MKTFYKSLFVRIIAGLLVLNGVLALNVSAQALTGTYYIPAAYGTPNFATIATAISNLNSRGVGSGGVIFAIQPGYTETFLSAATGTIQVMSNVPTAANPVTFKKGGVGSDPVITLEITAIKTTDAGINICGTSYITFDGIDITLKPPITNSFAQYGYAVTRASSTQGSQHVTIKNCTITTLLNIVPYLSAAIFQGNTLGDLTTAADPTSASGTHSYNSYYGNTVNLVSKLGTPAGFFGIYLNGGNATLDATLPTSYYDSYNSVGVTGQNPNSLFIGGKDLGDAIIDVTAQQYTTVTNNIIRVDTNNAMNGDIGIWLGGGKNTTATISNNDLSLRNAGSSYTNAMNGIYNSASVLSLTISDNYIHDCQETNITYNGGFFGIIQTGGAPNSTVNISGNTISNNYDKSGITNYGVKGIWLAAFPYTTINTTVDHNVIMNNTSLIDDFWGIDLLRSTISSTSPISVHDNQIYNNSSTGILSSLKKGGNVYGIQMGRTLSTVNPYNIYNNQLYNLSSSTQYEKDSSIVAGIYFPAVVGGGTSSGTVNMYGNSIHSLTGGSVAGGTQAAGGTSGGNTVYGIYLTTPGGIGKPSYNVYANQVFTLSGGGNGTIPAAGIYVNNVNGQSTNNVYNNFVADINSTGVYGPYGIDFQNANLLTNKVYFNSIYLNQQASVNNASTFYSAGLYINGASNGIDIRNNLVVNTGLTGTGGKTIALYANAVTPFGALRFTSDRNCYYSGGSPNFIYYNSSTATGYTDINSYKTANGGIEVNSISINPGFTSATDLHVTNMTNSGPLAAGAPLGSPYLADIDGDVRSLVTPTIGADELSCSLIAVNAGPDVTICGGKSTLLKAIGGNPASYHWSPSTGLSNTNSGSPIANPTITTQYILTDSGGACFAGVTADTVIIKVIPGVVLNPISDTSICTGQSLLLNPAGSSSFSYTWSPGSNLTCTTCANPSASPITNVTYTVIAGNGTCSDTAQIKIKIGGAATAGIITAVRDTLCSGTRGNLTLSGNSSNIIQWESSTTQGNFTDINGVIDTTLYQTDPLSQTTYFRVRVGSGGCAAVSDTLQLFVPPALTANFGFTLSGLTATFSDSSIGNIISYFWTFGDGTSSIVPNPSHTYAKSDTTYNVCLTIYDGSNCSYTFCKDVSLVTGVNNIPAETTWTIYPNPFNDELLINGKELNRTILSVQVCDVLGRLVWNKIIKDRSENAMHLNVSALVKGVYFLKIQTSHANFIERIIKQ